jgi:regulator of sigma E protease
LQITIERAGQILQKTIVPEAYGASQTGSAGWVPKQPDLTITVLEPGMPAEKAGMQVGDKMIALNGQPFSSLQAMIETLNHTQFQPVAITVLRNGQPMTFTVRPVLAETEEPGVKRPRVGIGSEPTKVTTLPFTAALSKSVEESKENSLLILELIRKMIERKISMRSVDGPIGIAVATGRAASEKGWTPLLKLSSAISLNLGIMNLLPIPILDGGVILLLFLETLMQRDISLAIKERIYQAAFVFLVLFAVMVIYNDLAKALPGMMQRLP